MQEADVDRILARRLHPAVGAVQGAALTVALLLHLAAAAAAVWGPAFLRHPAPPRQVLPVKLVPLRALGVERPQPPAAPAKEPVKAAPPTPEPKKPQPKKPAPPVAAKPSKPQQAAPQPSPPRAGEREGSPHGSTLGISSKLGSEVGVDNPDFVYDYYLARMLAMIEAQWTRPGIDQPIEAQLHFRIGKDGTLSELDVVQASGTTSFDLAALRAVQNAAPFPPLPTSYRSDSLGVNLIVH
jgi:periplasmic protein TonB